MAFLDDIKERLGFGNSEEEEEFDEELYGDDFDAYAQDFDEYDSDGEEDQNYSSFAPITTRSARAGRQGRSSSPTRDRGSHPALVNFDDLRNSTRVPESLNRDPLPARRTENFGRNSVGHASDYALSGSEVQTTSSGDASSSYTSTIEAGQPASSAQATREGYDPYRAYEAGPTSSHRPTRNISVISPVAYGEVENVARMLRAGDAVVLSLRNTPSQLSKRILDFSFGVASALDATVDCIADKVFAITRISNLNEDELSRLRSQGVI